MEGFLVSVGVVTASTTGADVPYFRQRHGAAGIPSTSPRVATVVGKAPNSGQERGSPEETAR